MRVLGIHTMGHDTGVALLEHGRLRFAIETERLTRVKHDSRVEVALSYYLEHGPEHPEQVDLVAVSTEVRSRIAQVAQLDQAIAHCRRGGLHSVTSCTLLGHQVPCLVVTHEASHAALACHAAGWPASCLVLVNEGKGSFSRNALFLLEHDRLQLLEHDQLPWYGTGFGWSGLGYLLGFGTSPSVAGRVMAMGGYGQVSDRMLRLLHEVDREVHRLKRPAQEQAVQCLRRYLADNPAFEPRAQLVSSFQHLFQETVVEYLSHALTRAGAKALALGGGCALNLPLNTLIRSRLAPQVAIAPACNDAGQALGAALYAQQLYLSGSAHPFSVWSNGRQHSASECRAALLELGATVLPFDPVYVATCLAEGGVVAFFDGVPALGPRSLGHRSLLANPQAAGMRRLVSEELKQREWFRPLAPIMSSSAFSRCFPEAAPSPHMLFSYRPRSGLLPEATHVDGTARIQTVGAEAGPRLLAVLDQFERLTGVPGLINTSLNRRQRAIAYRPHDVIDDFAGTAVDLFVLGEVMGAQPTGRG